MIVDEQLAGQRLDNFLLRELKGVPRQLVYRLVRKGKVKVNSARAKPATKLSSADRIWVPALRTGTRASLGESSRPWLPPVVYEDDGLLVVDKPAGMPVHGGSGLSHGLIEQARLAVGNSRLELAHRLDKDTSGLLILVKKRSILRIVHELLREGAVKKIYAAVVFGKLSKEKLVIDAPLRKIEAARGGRRSVVDEQGKRAVTVCWQVEAFELGTEVGIELVTGKTHQARVHLASVGNPTIGDSRYGDRDQNRRAQRGGCRGLMLHARQLELELPSVGKLKLASPLPQRFEDARSFLSTKAK